MEAKKLNRQQLQILYSLGRTTLNFWYIVRKVNGTLKDLQNNLKELETKGLIGFDGKNFSLKKELPQRPDFDKLVESFRKYADMRPPPKSDFFQDPLVTEDLFNRVKLLYNRGDLEGRDIFILGDDDLFSIALFMTGLPNKIVVVEIDTRVTDVIKKIAKKNNFNIEVLEYNCADPLPSSFKGKYDVFVMDPVETEKGFAAFLSRGVEALRHPGAVYFGLTEIDCPSILWHKFQRDINKMNLITTDMLPKFNFYDEQIEGLSKEQFMKHQSYYDTMKLFRKSPFNLSYPDINWYHSTFIRLETVGKPKPLIKKNIKFDDSFYVNDYVMTTD
ncbi:MAG: bis-aminopropyl spermidine synthase family protein [Nanoarchaeota archaeon]|nr:bis-aminopropyl spermidine synthase family protein [Nanoarchaeota archaeon]MCG2717738.1 bis-aminopropyl spermidine synthase family protein [Nanoarchaeota archaeon]